MSAHSTPARGFEHPESLGQGTGSTVGSPKPAKRPNWWKRMGWRHALAVIAVVYAVFPILYVISASLNPIGTLTGSNKLFSAVTTAGYERVLNTPGYPFGAWFRNSLVVGLTTAVLSVFLCALAAYAFSRLRFTGRRVGLVSLIVIQMFPQLLAVVAIFLLMSTIDEVFPGIGLNSHIGLIMIYLGGALGVNTYLVYGFFNTIPASIDEAARVDGAGHTRIFFTIILRLAAPILAVVALLSFISTMNDFVIASVILIEPQQQTLAVGLYKMVSNPNYADWGAFSAGAVMAALPVVVIFMALQKYIVGGLTSGAVK